MPTSQWLLFLNRARMVGGPDMNRFVQTFLTNPRKKVVSDRKAIVVYRANGLIHTAPIALTEKPLFTTRLSSHW